MFKINDIQFNIKYAYLDAFVNDDENLMNIGIKIKTERNCNIDLIAEIESEVILKIEPNMIINWQDIVGKNIEWNEFPERGTKKPYAFLIYDEHEEIYNAKIKFKNINNKIYINISAFSNINYENNYLENVPLEIETEIDFFVIFCGDNEENNCKEEIEQYLNVIDYKYFKTILGVSILLPKNINMEIFKKVFGENYIV
jgi:hypothetical protein